MNGKQTTPTGAGADGPAAPASPPAEADAEPGGRTLGILVVDDDQVDRQAVRRTLVRAGVAAEVQEADGVLAAIALLTRRALDCVILDYDLPDGDGLTFLRGMRAAGVELPVIMLTGRDDRHLAAQLRAAGAADFVPKARLTPERLAASLRAAGMGG